MKNLFVTILITLTAFAGTSQPNTAKKIDTACIPLVQLIEAVKDRESHKLLQREFAEFKLKHQTLQAVVLLKDSAITVMNMREKLYVLDQQKTATQISNYEVALKKSEMRIAEVAKAGRRKSRGSFFKGMLGGALAGVVAGFLFIK